MKSTVRLSQCLIVKNEEKNIRRALTWGKDIVCEQIVVDTGSTDRTVEIAKEMGAKVFHFAWINDFSAAKNFAIDKAKGNWIVFLDADEYYSSVDANKIIPLLTRLEQNFHSDKRPHIVRSTLVNLNSKGVPGSAGVQDRIFQNLPGLRYQYSIHESLRGPEGMKLLALDAADKLTIFHTGYTAEAFEETDKLKRNISLLKHDIAKNPKNYNAWSYLGDSYFADGDFSKAEEAYLYVIEKMDDSVIEERKNLTFCNLLKLKYLNNDVNEEDVFGIYQKSRTCGCKSPDAEYWIGRWMFLRGKSQEGLTYYELALEKIDKYDGPSTLDIVGCLPYIYQTLFDTCKLLGRPSAMIKYGVLALRMNRYIENILKEILILLKKEPGELDTAEATFRFLIKLYDCSSLKDKLFLIKVSKMVPFPALEDRIYEMLSTEEKALLNNKERSPYRLSETERMKEYSDFVCKNETDQEFLALINEVQKREFSELTFDFRKRLKKLEEEHESASDNYVKCFSRFPNWGRLEPEENQYEALEQRIIFVQSNVEELIRLYSSLADYQSKKVLISILRSWIFLDTDRLQGVRRGLTDYYDLDLIPTGLDCVFVDAGAYNGDTIRGYINAYGEDYKKIYCYEVSREMTEALQRNLRSYKNIIARPAALDSCDRKTFLFVNEEDPSLNYLSNKKGTIPVNTTTLDADISDKINFLKIDINGYEKQAVLGASRHIKEEHPYLLIALYHKFENLTEIPRLISEMDCNYKLYLRYFGGDLIPTNFMLYAI